MTPGGKSPRTAREPTTENNAWGGTQHNKKGDKKEKHPLDLSHAQADRHKQKMFTREKQDSKKCEGSGGSKRLQQGNRYWAQSIRSKDVISKGGE